MGDSIALAAGSGLPEALSDVEVAVSLEVVVTAVGEDADQQHEAGWQAQVEVLHRALLDTDVDGVSRRVRAVADAKGAASDIVVALGTSGAVTAVVTVFRTWVSRARHRRIDVEINGVTYSVRGTDATDETLREVMLAALGRDSGDA
ncbi:hypothetical protein Lfu02_39690 [Longispora fulva]|uniref:Uncharacterized protein n=1 Tax=Longispora fulva TaxID=619741 RepID=A0A8J7KJ11_9ACTN|nr:hypothetical protein [Longispora fulva]MBG6136429.1 hypothetical protein [Longispora fulva]GIG59597.1 hypothetical protein Lfu02_39690 [Longispora fulva]